MLKRMLMGGGLVVGGVALAIGGGRAIYRAYASEHWPVVEGRMLSSSVETVRTRRSVSFRPHLRYSYSVEGQSYTSENISFGSGGGATSDLQEANVLVRRHAAGSPVQLHYSPSDPSLACVVCGKAGVADYVVTAGGVALALFAGSGLLDILRRGSQARRRRGEAAGADGARPQTP